MLTFLLFPAGLIQSFPAFDRESASGQIPDQVGDDDESQVGDDDESQVGDDDESQVGDDGQRR